MVSDWVHGVASSPCEGREESMVMGSRLINCVQLQNKNVFCGSCSHKRSHTVIANLKVLDLRAET